MGLAYPLTFDKHTHVLSDKLVALSLEESLKIFYKHVTPTMLVKELQARFKRDKEHVAGLITLLNTLIETKLGKREMVYAAVWDHDECLALDSFSLTRGRRQKNFTRCWVFQPRKSVSFCKVYFY